MAKLIKVVDRMALYNNALESHYFSVLILYSMVGLRWPLPTAKLCGRKPNKQGQCH